MKQINILPTLSPLEGNKSVEAHGCLLYNYLGLELQHSYLICWHRYLNTCCEIVALHIFFFQNIRLFWFWGFYNTYKLKYWKKKSITNIRGKHSDSGWKTEREIVWFSSCIILKRCGVVCFIYYWTLCKAFSTEYNTCLRNHSYFKISLKLILPLSPFTCFLLCVIVSGNTFT